MSSQYDDLPGEAPAGSLAARLAQARAERQRERKAGVPAPGPAAGPGDAIDIGLVATPSDGDEPFDEVGLPDRKMRFVVVGTDDEHDADMIDVAGWSWTSLAAVAEPEILDAATAGSAVAPHAVSAPLEIAGGQAVSHRGSFTLPVETPPVPDELAPVQAELAEVQAELAQCRAEAADARALADDLRARLEAIQAVAPARRDDGEECGVAGSADTDVITAHLIPMADDLDLAVAHVPASLAGDPWVAGVRIIASRFQVMLAQQGVERIDPVGEAFDPHRHEAVAQVENSEAAAETVMRVYRAGYALGGRVLRPAQVQVALGPGPAREEEQAE